MNVVTVKINGVEYNLKGEEKEEYLHKVASYVDKKVKNIIEGNNKLSTASAAVLSAINVVDDMFKVQDKYDKAIKECNKAENNDAALKEQIESFKKQMKHLEEYNAELQEKVKDSENSELIKEKDLELEKAKKELEIMQQTTQKYMEQYNLLKTENKELNFRLQSSKYKLIDLERKLVDNQISLVKEKKQNHPLLKDENIK
ncbi:cell division protein ZapA [Clostridium sp. JN-9]|uniref:cell division protein ZapA n=1 Tax=Clostridium sp. JN-9 TaxID=2507159 RepID=UPI000FFDFA89|nr:cell division protein ZapA [Clostridium sp. JN-9]QAT41074.1 cell division protein ZapA [Clostridium sp. JN-9]